MEWFQLSVTSAMHEIENENGPAYDESDLKERWRCHANKNIDS